MVWYQLVNFKQLKSDVKNLIYIIFFDFKNVFFDLKKIFKKPKSIFIFIIILPFIYFSLIFIFIISFIFFLKNCFFFLKNFIFNKNLYFTKSDAFTSVFNINDLDAKFYESTTLTHLYYYFLLYPKLKGYELMYNFFSLFFKKQVNNTRIIIIFVLILIVLPIRFFVKFFTGYSYISIKISSSITNSIIDLMTYEYDCLKTLADNVLLDFDSDYIFPLIEKIAFYKIYIENNKIVFNPWYEHFFPDLTDIKKALWASKKLFRIHSIQTTKMTKHPAYIMKIYGNEPNITTFIQQSSSDTRPILDSSGKPIRETAIHGPTTGAWKKERVYNYSPVTFNKEEDSVILQPVSTWKEPEFFSLQKKAAFQALMLGLFKMDKIIIDGNIVENPKFSYFIDRLIEAYNNKTLSQEHMDCVSYLLDFIEKNAIVNDYIKIIAWETLFTKSIITEDGNIFFPDYQNNDSNLPLAIQNILNEY